MTIILSIKVQDGVVMASDSAVMHRGHLYLNGEKNLQLLKGVPVGVLISGDGAIGTRALSGIIQDFGIRASLRGDPLYVNKEDYTVEELVQKLQTFIYDASMASISPIRSALILSGYSSGRTLPETWSVRFDGGSRIEPELVWNEDEYGLSWEGDAGCINRLLGEVLTSDTPVDTENYGLSLFNRNAAELADCEVDSPQLVTPGMPILDAVDVASFLMDTSLTFERLRADKSVKTIGGPVDLAVITRHDGFRWLQRKRPTGLRGAKPIGLRLEPGARRSLLKTTPAE